jgi:hypothetical protein
MLRLLMLRVGMICLSPRLLTLALALFRGIFVSLKRFVKDPQEVLDYTIDWSQWLVSGDYITAVTATAPTGIVITSPSAASIIGSGVNATATKVWVSGGTAGTSYDIALRVTTNGTRQGERSITIQVKDL